MTIELLDGSRVQATYIRHLRTLTHGAGVDNEDIDLYRLADGTTVEAHSPANDGRAIPVQQ
jgi:hypothetical protein